MGEAFFSLSFPMFHVWWPNGQVTGAYINIPRNISLHLALSPQLRYQEFLSRVAAGTRCGKKRRRLAVRPCVRVAGPAANSNTASSGREPFAPNATPANKSG
jgi:hypothetical protein